MVSENFSSPRYYHLAAFSKMCVCATPFPFRKRDRMAGPVTIPTSSATLSARMNEMSAEKRKVRKWMARLKDWRQERARKMSRRATKGSENESSIEKFAEDSPLLDKEEGLCVSPKLWTMERL